VPLIISANNKRKPFVSEEYSYIKHLLFITDIQTTSTLVGIIKLASGKGLLLPFAECGVRNETNGLTFQFINNVHFTDTCAVL